MTDEQFRALMGKLETIDKSLRKIADFADYVTPGGQRTVAAPTERVMLALETIAKAQAGDK